jgi:hypothetical protein
MTDETVLRYLYRAEWEVLKTPLDQRLIDNYNSHIAIVYSLFGCRRV